jgi:aminomethyltransferase
MSDDAVLPLDSWHRAGDARMVSFAGYAMPIQYEGIIAEHLWTRTSAGLFDVSHMGQLFFSGEDVDAAIEALTPADVEGLALGRQRYSLLLNGDGGIIDDLMIARWRQGIYMVVNGATKGADVAHIEPHLPENVTMKVLTDRALLALQGPKAAEALGRHVSGQYGLDALTFMAGGQYTLAGEDVWISRSGYTGEDGFEISLPATIAEAVAEALCGEPEVKPIGLGARDSLRLEAGLPLYGHDIDEHITPIEADLGFALSKRRREAGDFPGAAQILRQREEGASKKRVGLVVEGRQPVREGALVVDAEGNETGKVTSGGFSPSLEKPIAMAYVPAALAAPGTEIALQQRGKPFAGTVTALPFVPHTYHRQPKP